MLFYDGYNDIWSSNVLNELRSHDQRRVFDPTTRDAWRKTGRSEGAVPDGPRGARLLGEGRGGPMTPEEFAAVISRRYERSQTITKAEAKVHAVSAHFYWQPTRFSRPVVLAEPHDDASTENATRLREQMIRAALPDDVVDLSDVFDSTRQPLFSDEVHHNEHGARLVAEAIYADLASELRRLAREGGR